MYRVVVNAAYLVVLATSTLWTTGCRAIRGFGESRQTVNARRLSGMGLQAMHDGQWDIAETLFKDALEVSPTDDRAHWGLAESHWKRNERDLAIQHMQDAVRLSAKDPRFVQRLGKMYLDQGRLEDADEQSRLALASNRGSAEAWALRGDCLHAAGKIDEALAAYHQALRLQPDFPDVQIQAAEIYRQQQRYDRLIATLDVLQDGVGIDKTPARVDLLQGIARRRLGQLDEARQYLARAVAKSPEDPTVYIEIAALEYLQGDIAASQQSLQTAQQHAQTPLDLQQWMQSFEAEKQLAAKPESGRR